MTSMDSNRKEDLLAICFLILFTVLFFLKLFYPFPSLFVTPDFGGSDLWQLNLPAKFFLSQSLVNNTLPLWSSYIGMGFPVLAEGQIGTLSLSNLLLFKFLPFVTAFNLSFIFLFTFTALGTYLYLKTIKIQTLVSFFSALSFAFSGFFICHISHINLIQASSFLPWIFLFVERIFQKNKTSDYIIFALLISQQIFSGFPQITFITLVSLLLYTFFRLLFTNRNSFKKTVINNWLIVSKIAIFVFLGFSLSAIQLLPQFEFLKRSNREGGMSLGLALQYSFPLKNLSTLINPRALGTPENGSYPDLVRSDYAVFWENNAFLGFLPVLALLAGIFLIGKNKLIRANFLILVISLLFMLGKSSPLYVAYIFPPFSYFRVPSRFILPFIWSIIVICALALNYFFTKTKRRAILKITILLLMILSLIHLLSFSFVYNPVRPAEEILKPPETAKYLQNLPEDKQGRFFLIHDYEFWNQMFINKGWQNFDPFVYFRNNLNSNFNLIYDIPTLRVYPIQLTNRFNVFNGLLESGVKIENGKAEINDLSIKLLSFSNCQYIISPYEITSPKSLEKTYETKKNYPGFPSYKIYLNPQALPRAYFVTSTAKAETVDQFVRILADEMFDIGKTAIVEKDLPFSEIASTALTQHHTDYSLNWQKDSPQEIIIDINTPQKGLLVLADTYYPGWKAYVDNQETEILPVNLNSRGVIIDRGEHQIKFSYQPKSLEIGKLVSLGAVIILLLVSLFPRFSMII